MAKINNNDCPSLKALLTQAVDYLGEQERIEALSQLAQVDCPEILQNAQIDFAKVLNVLSNHSSHRSYSGLFQEPAHFQQRGISSVKEPNIDPDNPQNNQGYLRLFADLAAQFCGLSREDRQSITNNN